MISPKIAFAACYLLINNELCVKAVKTKRSYSPNRLLKNQLRSRNLVA